ncbi:hypothetical protein D0439_08795 [Lysinibacillus fusiformis]|uniref:winged helix-turn-helix transcriptional regulator n=1 Tax=Lysinibacillus sp. GbtcB16 TaxID=2824761 RepID=UPI0009DFB5A4|nr:winged helix-turn-helix transcriptional regulator [Lysinibacillus fusiformis]KAB0443760.1 hypothetical protein CH314_09065 [Lysinibacillus fusiformis]QDZ98723.1 hypothetical protein D0439_08795 [Lysinibacillus fusiformis]
MEKADFLVRSLRECLIIRKKYAQIPPKVEYSLFSKGKSIIPILDALCEWGEEQLQQISQGTMT